MPVSSWSTTAASNATADAASGINWAEGMAPGQVNDSARAMMAVIKGDFANSLATSGYQKLPNGLIIQWGQASNATLADFSLSFPVAFPSAALAVVATPVGSIAATSAVTAHPDSISATAFSLHLRAASNGGIVGGATGIQVHWIAIGV